MLKPAFKENETWLKLFEITMAVYRVTEQFPKDEILKIQIRGAANKLFAYYSQKFLNNHPNEDHLEELLGSVSYLRSLLLVAKENKFSKDVNFIVLDQEYKFFMDVASKEIISKKQKENSPKNDEQAELSRVNFIEKKNVPAIAPSIQKTYASVRGMAQGEFNERQQKIVGIFRERMDTRMRLNEVAKFLPDFSARTVRKDLSILCARGVINKNGSFGKNSFYWVSQN
jgi:hypothetical protein